VILANFGVIIDSAVGAILMSLSTVIVAINSQNLRRFEPKAGETIAEEKKVLMDSPQHTRIISFLQPKKHFQTTML
jgi:hypothetical protein